MSSEASFDTVIIGGGQAGLAAGYYLSQQGADYTILDENQRTGDSWRKRWDSLRLFTPSQNNYLPGLKFPKPDYYFPTKDETADFLESYANRFTLPVQYGTQVDSLSPNENGYTISAGDKHFHARNVIIASGAFHVPQTPPLAKDLNPAILQMHSSAYRNPEQVPASQVVVIGAGNSGAEIALELAKNGKQVWLSGRDVGRIPAEKLGRFFGGRLYWWFLRRVLTTKTPIGRRMKANVLEHGNPLIRTAREDVRAAGVEFTSRIAGTQDGLPVTADGKLLPVQGIIWATGFQPDYRWIKLPIFDEHGRPRHSAGVVASAPGIYFLGLHFQTGLASSLLGGVGEDARYITRQIR